MLRPIDFSSVADIYDSYVRTDSDIPFWLHEAGKSSGRILELGSGTGRVSLPLLKAGADLTCLDYCPEMLAVLKQKVRLAGLACTVVEMDMTQLSLPIQYDQVFLPFNSFSEILDKKSQSRTLSRIKAHLAEDGVFICTLQNPVIRRADLDGRHRVIGTFPSASGSTLTVTSELGYEKKSGIAHGFQFYEFLDKDGRPIGRRCLEVNFRLLMKEEFENLTVNAGLEVTDMFGDYDYAKFNADKSPHMIWRLKSVER